MTAAELVIALLNGGHIPEQYLEAAKIIAARQDMATLDAYVDRVAADYATAIRAATDDGTNYNYG